MNESVIRQWCIKFEKWVLECLQWRAKWANKHCGLMNWWRKTMENSWKPLFHNYGSLPSVSSKFVPEDYKKKHMGALLTFIKAYDKDDSLFNRVITGYETCEKYVCKKCELWNKKQFIEWKCLQMLSTRKIMVTVFWDREISGRFPRTWVNNQLWEKHCQS